MSLVGALLKKRPYSLLNWDALRYPTCRHATVASVIVDSMIRLASWRRSTFWYCRGLMEVTERLPPLEHLFILLARCSIAEVATRLCTSFRSRHQANLLNQLDRSLSALLTLPPLIAKPGDTFELGQSLLISRSLLPIPLPSCVQNGIMVFPEKS